MGDFFIMACQQGRPLLESYGSPRDLPQGWVACRYISNSPDDEQKLYAELRAFGLRGGSAGVRPVGLALKAIVFDFDATLIAEESLDSLAEAYGCAEAVAALTTEAMAGRMSFREALVKRVAMLKGMPFSELATLGAKLKLQPGAEALAARCRQAGIRLFIASGGFSPLIAPVASRLGVEAFVANEFGRSGARLNGSVATAIVDGPAKARFVSELCRQHGWHRHEVAAVGDGANDRSMMGEVGLAVGFCPKEVLVASLHVVNQSGDHQFLQDFLFALPPAEA